MNGPIPQAAYQKGVKHTAFMAVSSVARIIFGFLPHVLIAKLLGLGYATDSYLMAIAINQIIVKFFRIGTLPKIFIMVLSDDLLKDKTKTHSNINNFLNALLLFSFLAMALIYFLSPFLVDLIAKGFSADKKIFTIGISRILIPLLFYQCVISLFEGVFKLRNEFSSWAILSVIPALLITVFVYLYTQKIGIYSMVYGTLASSLVHLLFLTYFIFVKFRYAYRFELNFRHELFPKALKLLFPYYLSSVPVQVMLGVQSFLVSLLPTGFASVFFYARRIIDYVEQFSVNIFSQLMLPYFTKKISDSSIGHIRKVYAQLICLTNYTHLPFLIILAVLGSQIVEILFANKFTSPDIMNALGLTLSCFMVFFLAEPSNDVQFNIILAMKKTAWVNVVNTSRMAVVILLSLVLFKYFKFWGLIFSYSLTHLQGFIINQWYLRRRHSFENIFHNPGFIKITLLNAALGCMCFALNYFLMHNFPHEFLCQEIVIIGIVSGMSIAFYIGLSYLFKIEELRTIQFILRPGH